MGLIIWGFVIFGFVSTDCSENSESVLYAKSLSKERLEMLYYDMERLSHDESVPLAGYYKNRGEESFPECFSDIQAVKIRPSRLLKKQYFSDQVLL